jgi:hypothetical protein
VAESLSAHGNWWNIGGRHSTALVRPSGSMSRSTYARLKNRTQPLPDSGVHLLMRLLKTGVVLCGHAVEAVSMKRDEAEGQA